ncbi:MAG: hypothetical protein KJO26_08570 [Deltaproteobacteria bacterium]|nr:hypothetical protein [Deltaproteobacteria bacterium]
MYKIIIIFMVMVFLVVGCGSKPAIIPQDKTVTMQSVYPPADSKFRTYSAMLLALIDNKCRVTALDLDKNIITAENCYKMSKFCMSIKGIISLDWQATFILADKGLGERRISKIATNLQVSYLNYSKLSTDHLTDKIDDTVFWESIQVLANN